MIKKSETTKFTKIISQKSTNMKKTFFLILILILFLSCTTDVGSEIKIKKENIRNQKSLNEKIDSLNIENIFDTLFVDGFDFPIENMNDSSENVSQIETDFFEQNCKEKQTGIDIKILKNKQNEFSKAIFSIGKGIIIKAKNSDKPLENVVIIKHKYLENNRIKYCFSVYSHLDTILVKKGDFVNKHATLGSIQISKDFDSSFLHFEIRKKMIKNFDTEYLLDSQTMDSIWNKANSKDPIDFIKTRKNITCPYKEDRIIIVIKRKYKLYYFEKNVLKNEYDIALSQDPIGHKEREGDRKLPEGEYYIFGKQKGPFYDFFSEFLGTRLLRISYPNIFDANIAYEKKVITKQIRDKIVSANLNKHQPPQTTKLGGGIVIHGWISDWIADGNQNLTWGCISMLNRDIEKFYDKVQIQTKIIIFP